MTNGNFELPNFQGWTAVGWVQDGQDPIHGSLSAMCLTTGYNGATVIELTSDVCSVQVGTEYEFRFRYRPGMAGSNITKANPLQVWIDNGITTFAQAGTLIDQGDHVTRGGSFQFTAGGPTARLRFKVDLQTTGGDDPVWMVDTVELKVA